MLVSLFYALLRTQYFSYVGGYFPSHLSWEEPVQY